jgi:hypothetical protein
MYRRYLLHFLSPLLFMPPDLNTPGGADIPGETWAEGDLPSQGGGMPTLMPGIDEFTLPLNLAQCWGTIKIKDSRQRLSNGQPNPTYGQEVTRLQLKFDRNNPLVIASGPKKGEPMTATFSSNPRPRGNPEEDKTPWVSDLAYMLEVGLADKSRPTTADALKQRITMYAGKTFRMDHGLSAHCRPDKVRYIIVALPGGGEQTVQDPKGTKGCGDDTKKRADGKGKQGRYYTKDFKDPESGEYMDTIECDCGAILRGFPSVERFVPPLGAGAPTK